MRSPSRSARSGTRAGPAADWARCSSSPRDPFSDLRVLDPVRIAFRDRKVAVESGPIAQTAQMPDRRQTPAIVGESGRNQHEAGDAPARFERGGGGENPAHAQSPEHNRIVAANAGFDDRDRSVAPAPPVRRYRIGRQGVARNRDGLVRQPANAQRVRDEPELLRRREQPVKQQHRYRRCRL